LSEKLVDVYFGTIKKMQTASIFNNFSFKNGEAIFQSFWNLIV